MFKKSTRKQNTNTKYTKGTEVPPSPLHRSKKDGMGTHTGSPTHHTNINPLHFMSTINLEIVGFDLLIPMPIIELMHRSGLRLRALANSHFQNNSNDDDMLLSMGVNMGRTYPTYNSNSSNSGNPGVNANNVNTAKNSKNNTNTNKRRHGKRSKRHRFKYMEPIKPALVKMVLL